MEKATLLMPLLATLACSAFGAVNVENHCSSGQAIAGEYLVRIQNSALSGTQNKTIQALPIWVYKKLSHGPTPSASGYDVYQQKTSLAPVVESVLAIAQSPEELEQIQIQPNILSIESNCLIKPMAITPNDPDLSKNTGLDLIRATEAWSIIHDSSVVIAVPDTGVDVLHTDLKDNIWINQKEANGRAGIDDDNNGYVDDIYGWAFSDKNNDVTPGSYLGSDHGTHVAGIIGASGNNGYGSSGVVWNSTIMVLRPFKKASEDASTADLVESIYYAVNNGAKIINCSWGAEQVPTMVEADAFQFAESQGVFVVVASGNDSKDAELFSPGSLGTVFSVGSVNSYREISTFSNYGKKIGILAPGGDAATSFGIGRDESIYSTIPGGGFDFKKGTSVSAPFVTGVAALVKSLLPQVKPKELRKILHDAGDKITIRTGGANYTYAVLNAERALSVAKEISATQPNCSENCVFSGSGDLSSMTPGVQSKFGGGCELRAPLQLEGPLGNSKSASASWDLALLLCFILPAGKLSLGRKKNGRDHV